MRNTKVFFIPPGLLKKALIALILVFSGLFAAAQTNNQILIDGYRTELRGRGDLKEAEIEKMVADYTKFLSQKKPVFILPITKEMRANPSNCKNGGFEDLPGSFSFWSFYTGCNWGGLPIGSDIRAAYGCCNALPLNTQGTSTAACGQFHGIRNAGSNDPVLTAATPSYNLPLVPLGGGSRSAILGNSEKRYAVEGLYRTITLPAVNPTITFKYAVISDSSHSFPNGTKNGTEVFFLVRVKDLLNNEIARYEEVSSPDNPFVQRTKYQGKPMSFRDWECVTLDMKGHEGKTVTVEFINSDCSWGGHMGYTYLDDFCVECKGRPSTGGTVSIAKTDSCILGTTQVTGSFVLPTSGGNTGTLTSLQLLIYQNGAVVNTVSGATISGTNYTFNLSAADFPPNANQKCYDLIVKATFSLVNPYSGQTSTITGHSAPTALAEGVKPGRNNDICYCPEASCCPTENLIKNPFFDAGNVNFTSDYTYENTAVPNSVMPGEYSVVNSTQAAVISPQWVIKNPVTCDNSSKFLVANGRTGQTGKKKIWEQTVSGVKPNMTYRFCVKMKNLPQCAFDVKPSVEIQFSSGASPLIQTINTGSGACDWTPISVTVTPTTTTLSIKILLDETPVGDGNDLAIDAFGLHEMSPLAQAFRDFTVASFNMNTSLQTYNITATPVIPLPAGCSYFWDICEIDCSGACKDCNMGNCKPNTQVANPSQWWTGGTTNFPGYNGTSTLSGSAPGVFEYGKRYLIKRAVFCDCNAWSESKWCVEYDPTTKRVTSRLIKN